MMGIFATRTGINIYPSIYIENKVMDKLMKEKISADDLVPRFKDLEWGKSILICAPQLERDTEKAQLWDEAAGLSKQNWGMDTEL